MSAAQIARVRSPGLDLARTLGVTGVLLAHSAMFLDLLGYPLESLMPLHAWGGFFGVELFFALSGLLIGEILFRDVLGHPTPAKLGIFLLRRWLRTLPAYYVVLGCLVLLALWQGESLPPLWRYLCFLQNASPDYAVFFGVSWSLSIEQWAYIILPLLLWCGHWYSLKKGIPPERAWLWLLLVALAACAIVRLMLAFSGPAYWDNDFRKQVLVRLDTVGYGVLLAWIRHFKPAVYQRMGTLPCLVIALILLGFIARQFTLSLLQPDGDLFMKSLSFSLTDALCAMTLAFLDTNARVRSLLHPQRPFGLLCLLGSRYSYSLYLVHFTVFSLTIRWLNLTNDRSSLSVFCGFALALALSGACAALLYHSVEKPSMGLRRTFSFKPPA